MPEADGTSDYHALRFSVTKQFSRDWQFQTSYTYSKSTDDGSNWNGSNDFQSDIRCYGQTKCHAFSAFDFRHNFSDVPSYGLPKESSNPAQAVLPIQGKLQNYEVSAGIYFQFLK